jgi:hypothetical protein
MLCKHMCSSTTNGNVSKKASLLYWTHFEWVPCSTVRILYGVCVLHGIRSGAVR